MTTLTRVNVATRELVDGLEHRIGGKRRLHLIGGIAGLIVLIVLVRTVATGKKAAVVPPPRQVIVAKVTTQDAPVYLDEIGTCAAVETVLVQSQVSGQIVSRDFDDGSDVKKGDVLFKIDPRAYEAALAQAQGQLAQAQSQVVLDQITVKRQQELRAKNVISPQELDTAQATLKNDEAKVKSAEGAVAAAQVNLDFCTIRSPIDGRAGLRNVDAGNIVSAGNGGGGGTTLLTIQKLDPIYTDFTVSETDIPFVRQYLGGPNVKVETRAPDDNQPARTGDLYFLDNAIQPGVGTVKARAVTPNSDRTLWPSQFVRVRLILDMIRDAKLVPNGAVQIGQNGPYIFIVKPDSTLELRPVKPGQPQGDFTVIIDGVRPNETVVVSGQLQLSPGTKVITKPMETPAQGGDAMRMKTVR
jgi:multidrug efflux system membrane fusion protein